MPNSAKKESLEISVDVNAIFAVSRAFAYTLIQIKPKEYPMDLTIVVVYTICDDLLISLGHSEHPQTQMSDAEVMTIVISPFLFVVSYRLSVMG